MSGSHIPWAWRPRLGLRNSVFERFDTVRIFLSAMGLVYFIAFTSFGVQAIGLVGSHGIEPFADYLRLLRSSAGPHAWWDAPTLLWFIKTDAALRAVWIGGSIASLAAVFAPWPRTALAVCWVLWLSACAVGQDFLLYQWDSLLLEAGFLAIFADRSPGRVWLFRWLIFRLMFSSGMVKFLSGDPTWRDLTALHYHYETQPLPNPIAWYMYQLPMWFQRLSTAFVLIVEVPVPFLFFAPGRWRHTAACLTIALQLLIFLTGNYTFFNILTVALVAWLFIEPVRVPRSKRHRTVTIVLVCFFVLMGGLLLIQAVSIPLPPGGSAVLHAVAPARIVNSYGLFAEMVTLRPEVIIEGSNDEVNWQAYEFPYKPGDVRRPPPWVEPYQPRLDWQMAFAGLGSYQENPWFVNLMVRLLQGEPAVLRLLRYNPFPNAPPRYIRGTLYIYHFTHFGQPAWWIREEQGLYFPPASLK